MSKNGLMVRLMGVFTVLALGSGKMLNVRGEIKLLSAVTSKNLAAMQTELKQRRDKGFRLDWVDPHRRTLLHLSVLNQKHPEVLEYLLTLEVPLYALDDRQRSALQFAIDKNNEVAAKTLIEKYEQEPETSEKILISALAYCLKGLEEQPQHRTCQLVRNNLLKASPLALTSHQ